MAAGTGTQTHHLAAALRHLPRPQGGSQRTCQLTICKCCYWNELLSSQTAPFPSLPRGLSSLLPHARFLVSSTSFRLVNRCRQVVCHMAGRQNNLTRTCCSLLYKLPELGSLLLLFLLLISLYNVQPDLHVNATETLKSPGYVRVVHLKKWKSTTRHPVSGADIVNNITALQSSG